MTLFDGIIAASRKIDGPSEAADGIKKMFDTMCTAAHQAGATVTTFGMQMPCVFVAHLAVHSFARLLSVSE
jgi:hypothetical protein